MTPLLPHSQSYLNHPQLKVDHGWHPVCIKLPDPQKVIAQEYAKQWKPFKFSSLSEHSRHLNLVPKGLIWCTVVWQLRHCVITLTSGAEKLTPSQLLLKFAKVELQFDSWNVLAIPPNLCGMADFTAIYQSICLSSSFFGMKPDNTTGHKNGSQDISLSPSPPLSLTHAPTCTRAGTHTHTQTRTHTKWGSCIVPFLSVSHYNHILAIAFVLHVFYKWNGNLDSWVTAYYHIIYIKNIFYAAITFL